MLNINISERDNMYIIISNLGNIIVGLILTVIVCAIIKSMIKNKKNGKSNGCGCNCTNCPNAEIYNCEKE